MSRNCNNNNNGGGIGLIIIVAIVLLSVVLFAPGMAITALINEVVEMKMGPLWGTTLICTIVICFYLYRKHGKYIAIRMYLIWSVCIFAALAIFSLYVPDNIFLNTLKMMYPAFA